MISSAAWSTVDHLDAVFGRLQAAVDDWTAADQVRRTIDALRRTAQEVGDEASASALRRLRDTSKVAAGPPPRREQGSAGP